MHDSRWRQLHIKKTECAIKNNPNNRHSSSLNQRDEDSSARAVDCICEIYADGRQTGSLAEG